MTLDYFFCKLRNYYPPSIPPIFFTPSFLISSSQFFTFQNFLEVVNFYNVNTNSIHYFHPPFSIYQLHINEFHHFVCFIIHSLILCFLYNVCVIPIIFFLVEALIFMDTRVGNCGAGFHCYISPPCMFHRSLIPCLLKV